MKRERGIWQRRFWEHCIRDEEDFIRHIDYIHYYPVKHGYVEKAYSSIHRYMQKGILNKEWDVALDF
jgi:putative transposase